MSSSVPCDSLSLSTFSTVWGNEGSSFGFVKPKWSKNLCVVANNAGLPGPGARPLISIKFRFRKGTSKYF